MKPPQDNPGSATAGRWSCYKNVSYTWCHLSVSILLVVYVGRAIYVEAETAVFRPV